jgi:hypothetical protein
MEYFNTGWLTPAQTWAVVLMIVAIVTLWISAINEEKEEKKVRYAARCLECKWYFVAPSEIEAAQAYGKHYSERHEGFHHD